MEFELHVVTAASDLTPTSRLSRWDSVIVMQGGRVIVSPTPEKIYEDIESTYTWVFAQTVRFVYVTPLEGDGDSERLAYLATGGTYVISSMTNRIRTDKDGLGEPYIDDEREEGSTTPWCFSPEPELIIRAYLGEPDAGEYCYAGGFDITDDEGTILTSIEPLTPEIPR